MSERLKWWFWHFASLLRDPLFLYLLQCPPSMRRIPGTLHHRWRMALFGAIQLPSRLGRFQSRTEAHVMRYSVRDVHAHSCIKGGGDWRGEAGEGGVKCLRGSVWEWRRNFHLQTPPLAPQQHRAKTAPSTSQRHPPRSPFRPFRSGWPKLTRASVRHQSSPALPGSTPAN